MTRSAWKGKFVYNFLLKHKFSNRNKPTIWTRNSTIPSFLIGKYVFIYNGKKFFRVRITRQKIGFKFGEFAFTRTLPPKPKLKVKTKSKKLTKAKPVQKAKPKPGKKK